MFNISNYLEEKAKRTIAKMIESGNLRSQIEDVPGFFVIRGKKEDDLVLLKKNIFENETFQVCMDTSPKTQGLDLAP